MNEEGVAPFTGAWIEIISTVVLKSLSFKSHPSRVRGLKYVGRKAEVVPEGRRTLHGCVD